MDRLNEAHQHAKAGLVDRFELWPHLDHNGKLRSLTLTMTIGEVQHLAVFTWDRRNHSTALSMLLEAAHAIRTILGDGR